MHFIRVQTGLRSGYGALEKGLEFKAYTFGAFVLQTHPKDFLFLGSKAVKDKRVIRKLRNRVVPAIYVGVSV